MSVKTVNTIRYGARKPKAATVSRIRMGVSFLGRSRDTHLSGRAGCIWFAPSWERGSAAVHSRTLPPQHDVVPTPAHRLPGLWPYYGAVFCWIQVSTFCTALSSAGFTSDLPSMID